MIQGVLFDMDGVLFDTEALGRELMPKAARAYGKEMDHALYHRLLGVNEHLGRQILLEAYGEDFPYEPFHDQFLQYFLDIASEGRLPRKPGLSACMQGLKARGIRIALATSTRRPVVEHYLRHTPELTEVFDATVCGIEVPRGKPEPDIYLEAARQLGLRPEECLGVEDSRNGLRSVRAAGAVSVMIPDLLPFSDELAPFVDHVLTDLNGLCPLIDRLNGVG